MKREFEVGQQVRIRQWEDMEKEFGCDGYGDIKCNHCFTAEMKHLTGAFAEIRRIYDDGECELDFYDVKGDTCYTYSTDMIEHYFPTFEELIGNVVETRDGKRYLCLKTDNGICFTKENNWYRSKQYSDNLLYDNGDDDIDDRDIMKVYKPSYGNFSQCLKDAKKLIWERPEEVEEVKEMTIADVEKLVGCKVKIIKETE